MTWHGQFITTDEFGNAVKRSFAVEVLPSDTMAGAALKGARSLFPDDADLISLDRKAGMQGYTVILNGGDKYGFAYRHLGTIYMAAKPR